MTHTPTSAPTWAFIRKTNACYPETTATFSNPHHSSRSAS